MALPQAVRMIAEIKARLVEMSGFLVPSGVILMWGGSADTIPRGWALCDGTNGTPDLLDRFVVASGRNYPQGSKGGAESATPDVSTGTAKTGIGIQGTTLDGNTLPSHHHMVCEYAGTSGENQNHIEGKTNGPSGTFTSNAGNSWGHAHGVSDPGHAHAVGSSEHAHGVSDPTHGHTVATEAHNHTLTDGGHAHTVTAKAISTLPPFVALFYIKKL